MTIVDKLIATIHNPTMWFALLVTILSFIGVALIIDIVSEIIFTAKYKAKLDYKKKLKEQNEFQN